MFFIFEAALCRPQFLSNLLQLYTRCVKHQGNVRDCTWRWSINIYCFRCAVSYLPYVHLQLKLRMYTDFASVSKVGPWIRCVSSTHHYSVIPLGTLLSGKGTVTATWSTVVELWLGGQFQFIVVDWARLKYIEAKMINNGRWLVNSPLLLIGRKLVENPQPLHF